MGNRLDHQPLFGKGARAQEETLTRHERAAEIESVCVTNLTEAKLSSYVE